MAETVPPGLCRLVAAILSRESGSCWRIGDGALPNASSIGDETAGLRDPTAAAVGSWDIEPLIEVTAERVKAEAGRKTSAAHLCSV